MTDLPLHKVAQISDYGIFLKAITATSTEDTVMYSHRDDYYIFGLIDEGECSLCIDFKGIGCKKCIKVCKRQVIIEAIALDS